MSASSYALAGIIGALTAIGFDAATRPATPTYTIAASSISTVPADAMVDFGERQITMILAWTDGHGAVVSFDGLDCMYGIKGETDDRTSLLRAGKVVHVRGHLYSSVKNLQAESFDCEVVPDGTP